MIRLAKPGDLESIVAIYNQAIDSRYQTAFTEHFKPSDRMQWLAEHLGAEFPMYVYTINDAVVGWISISPYRKDRPALKYAVEVSYFIDKEHQGQGIGSKLMERMLEACRTKGYRSVMAILQEKNVASIKLLGKFGFERWAYLPGIAVFEGVEHSQVYYGIRL